jgi:hypothetical protein
MCRIHAVDALRGRHGGGSAQPHDGCWTPELRSHLSCGDISRCGLGKLRLRLPPCNNAGLGTISLPPRDVCLRGSVGCPGRQVKVQYQVAVLVHAGFDLVAQGRKIELRAFTPGELHGRYKVAVTGNQHNGLHLLLKREGGNVHADAHVNALLRNLRLQVFVPDDHAIAGSLVQNLGIDGSAVKGQIAQAQSDMR